jgi:hypothetical protein
MKMQKIMMNKTPCPHYSETLEHQHLWKSNTRNYQSLTPYQRVKLLAREYNKQFLFEVDLKPWPISENVWGVYVWVPKDETQAHIDGNQHFSYDILSYVFIRDDIPVKSMSLQAFSHATNQIFTHCENTRYLPIASDGILTANYSNTKLRLIIETPIDPGCITIGCRVLPEEASCSACTIM